MRNIVYNCAVSLDGFIEDANGAFDWCFSDQDYGMTAFFDRIGAVLYGRKSYELMIRMGEKFDPARQHYVVSKTLTSLEPGVTQLSGDLKTEVEAIRQQPGGDIWLFGGAALAGAMLELDLVDELLFSVHPVVLGGGKPLFEGAKQRRQFKLVSSEAFSSGLIQLRYLRAE